MTEGEIGFRSGDRDVVLGPGGYITKPRGEAHAMWNAGQVPARMIEVISPAGFEHFFWGLGEAIGEGGPPDPAVVAAGNPQSPTLGGAAAAETRSLMNSAG